MGAVTTRAPQVVDYEAKLELLRLATHEQEAQPDFSITGNFSTTVALCVIEQLHLALRQPDNDGVTAMIAQQTVNSLLAAFRRAGMTATARMCELSSCSEVE